MATVKSGTQPNWSRSQITDFMADGRGSYILDGQHYMKAEDLPSESELAGEDPEAMRAAAQSLEDGIKKQLAELHRLQERQANAGQAPRPVAAAPRVGHPRVAGPIPKEGPVQPAPLDLRPGAHAGDGHDPHAEIGPLPEAPANAPAPTVRTVSPALRPGGVHQVAGPPPPAPELNSPRAHQFARPRYSPTEDTGDEEAESVGQPPPGAIPKSVDAMLAGMTQEQKDKAVADAKAATEAKANPPETKPEAPKPAQPQAQPEPAKPITVSSGPAK